MRNVFPYNAYYSDGVEAPDDEDCGTGVFLAADDESYLNHRSAVLLCYLGDSSSARTFPPGLRPRDVLCGLNLGRHLSSFYDTRIEVATLIFAFIGM